MEGEAIGELRDHPCCRLGIEVGPHLAIANAFREDRREEAPPREVRDLLHSVSPHGNVDTVHSELAAIPC